MNEGFLRFPLACQAASLDKEMNKPWDLGLGEGALAHFPLVRGAGKTMAGDKAPGSVLLPGAQ